jgi:DNA-binding NtrC family response regulator
MRHQVREEEGRNVDPAIIERDEAEQAPLRTQVHLRILVVDDDPDICEYMKVFLTGEGHEVFYLTDPTKAVEEIKVNRYHIAIVDLMMPGLDGMELLRQIRHADSDIAIVIFTGHADVDSAVAAMKLDVSDYLRKPFEIETFKRTIAEIAAKKGLMRNPERDLHLTIGNNIRRLRKERDLTLKQMARRTGLSVSLLSQIERAESSASISSLYKVASALNVPLTNFLGGR